MKKTYFKKIVNRGLKRYEREYFEDDDIFKRKYEVNEWPYLDVSDRKEDTLEFWTYCEGDNISEYECKDFHCVKLTKEEEKIYERYTKAWKLMNQ